MTEPAPQTTQAEAIPTGETAPAAAVETPAVVADAPAVTAPEVTAPASEAAAPVVPVTSLISDEAGKTATEAPAQTETPPTAETAPAEAPPAVTWSDFILPEGVQMDDASMNTFKEVLGGELPPQERGQRLIDMHLAELQRHVQATSDNQVKVWNDTQTQWKEAVRADPELGGNRYNTTIQTCISAVNRFGGSPEQRAQLLQALDFTGAGNNPAIIRLVHNMAGALQESSPVTQTAAPNPPQSRAQKRYNASGAN